MQKWLYSTSTRISWHTHTQNCMLINNKERKRTVSRNVKLFGGENRMTPLRKQHVPSDAKGQVNTQILVWSNSRYITLIWGKVVQNQWGNTTWYQRTTKYPNSNADQFSNRHVDIREIQTETDNKTSATWQQRTAKYPNSYANQFPESQFKGLLGHARSPLNCNSILNNLLNSNLILMI